MSVTTVACYTLLGYLTGHFNRLIVRWYILRLPHIFDAFRSYSDQSFPCTKQSRCQDFTPELPEHLLLYGTYLPCNHELLRIRMTSV